MVGEGGRLGGSMLCRITTKVLCYESWHYNCQLWAQVIIFFLFLLWFSRTNCSLATTSGEKGDSPKWIRTQVRLLKPCFNGAHLRSILLKPCLNWRTSTIHPPSELFTKTSRTKTSACRSGRVFAELPYIFFTYF